MTNAVCCQCFDELAEGDQILCQPCLHTHYPKFFDLEAENDRLVKAAADSDTKVDLLEKENAKQKSVISMMKKRFASLTRSFCPPEYNDEKECNRDLDCFVCKRKCLAEAIEKAEDGE